MAINSKTRSAAPENFGGGFTGALALHGAAAAALLGLAYLTHSGQTWGDAHSTDGAIQATMVNALPLPAKQPVDPDNVLATESPSPAPIPPTPHTVEVAKPDAIAIPVKPTKPAPAAAKNTPPPPLHPQPVKVDPNKAPSGEAPGINIAMSSTETHAGTVSVGAQDAAFGTRFAYYVQQIQRKVAGEWYTGMLDPQAAGHRVSITFQVERDGSPTRIQIAQPSGDATLDQTALTAVRHIDTFGPLPDAYTGSHINVTYYFDPSPRP